MIHFDANSSYNISWFSFAFTILIHVSPPCFFYNKLMKPIPNLWKYVQSLNIFMRIFLGNIRNLGDDFIVVIFGCDFQWSKWAKK